MKNTVDKVLKYSNIALVNSAKAQNIFPISQGDTMKTVIRVGEKNNFNQTEKEFAALKPFEKSGLIFVNSNSFTEIKNTYPAIVTVNPYMVFTAIRGDLSNVKACRIKVFRTDILKFSNEQINAIQFCVENNLPILLTYMRYRSKNTAEQFSGENFRSFYKWEKNYFRPTNSTKENLFQWVKQAVRIFGGNDSLVNECDSKGNGCPACGNCHKLTYGIENAEIKALNLSISGIEDKHGKKGLCPFSCPDCFAKIVTYGKSPACDRLITNKKIDGKTGR